MVDQEALPDVLDGRVAVTYALPERHLTFSVALVPDMTVAQAIERSGILDAAGLSGAAFDAGMRVGIYGKIRALDTLVRTRDRIEIYRPLVADPKEARRRRAAHRARAGSGAKDGGEAKAAQPDS